MRVFQQPASVLASPDRIGSTLDHTHRQWAVRRGLTTVTGPLANKSALLVFVATALAACASGPALIGDWKNPNYSGPSFQNILVIFLRYNIRNSIHFIPA